MTDITNILVDLTNKLSEQQQIELKYKQFLNKLKLKSVQLEASIISKRNALSRLSNTKETFIEEVGRYEESFLKNKSYVKNTLKTLVKQTENYHKVLGMRNKIVRSLETVKEKTKKIWKFHTLSKTLFSSKSNFSFLKEVQPTLLLLWRLLFGLACKAKKLLFLKEKSLCLLVNFKLKKTKIFLLKSVRLFGNFLDNEARKTRVFFQRFRFLCLQIIISRNKFALKLRCSFLAKELKARLSKLMEKMFCQKTASKFLVRNKLSLKDLRTRFAGYEKYNEFSFEQKLIKGFTRKRCKLVQKILNKHNLSAVYQGKVDEAFLKSLENCFAKLEKEKLVEISSINEKHKGNLENSLERVEWLKGVTQPKL